ncbi:hypothetical protein LSCM1_03230 [Leishmania martiniquensis]|uniref:Protein kinase domain-containing protein n=1 Tax=Leishmania martiniquensis TaxID=1580590 RepID=A0A836HB52_9TRYP|nr:hypothetical protein LSCM1_03230 [Leishmania martiniquensis]
MTAGKVIGNEVQYRLDAPIASGAFSTVWRCTELSSGQTYAMKIVDKRVAQREKMTEALIREVNALDIAGSSPYVTGLVDRMISKHNYYLVMDLVEGGTLLDLIRERRQELRRIQLPTSSGRSPTNLPQSLAAPFMPYDRVQHYFKQLLLALSTLHDRDIVHRDVKPENILLNKRRTRVVLSDFGFACHCAPGSKLHRACGTLKYCAPELLREHPSYDGRKVDVWAAGVTLYVMLFGGFPYRCSRSDPDAMLELIETTTYSLPRPIPAVIEDMLQHMLCVDAAQRWTVKQLLQHPWMSVLELYSPSACSPLACSPTARSPSARSTASERSQSARALASEALTPLVTTVPITAGVLAEMLLHDCPLAGSLPFDEDDVDDGFYRSIDHFRLDSSTNSCPIQVNTPTLLARQRSSHASSQLSHREDATLSVSSSASRLQRDDSTTVQGGEWGTCSASASFAVSTPSARPLRTPKKQKILQCGIEFTSMTSIKSSSSSDETEGVEREDNSGDENDDADEVLEGTVAAGLVGSMPVETSLAACAPSASDTQRPARWGRYAYGLWLTTSMAAHFVAFVVVCVVAVALRVFLKCDIIDLPLPKVVRGYISFILATPLRRPHTHLSGAAPTLSRLPGASSAASPLAGHQEDSHVGSSTPRPPVPAPLLGSGLRYYVRTADKMMRDSFVGSVVMSRNASLMDFIHRSTSAPLSRQLSEDHPISTSPALRSRSTTEPIPSCESCRSPEEVTTNEAYAEVGERAAMTRLLSSEKSQRSPNRPASRAGGRGEGSSDQRGQEERASLLDKEESSPQLSPTLFLSAEHPISATTGAIARLKNTTDANTLPKSEFQLVDSQGGSTDDTGSGGRALNKLAYSPHQTLLHSPIAPMPTAPGADHRGAEDFPLIAETAHA